MLAVSIAILLSKTGASTLSGVASVFPAIFWTTMVSLWLAQGQAVPVGAVGPMMLGSSSVAVFALIAPTAYQYLGSIGGCCIAWFCAAIFAALPSFLWLQSRRLKPDNSI